ncbi:hypothetical protein CPC08DRAFT_762488 [Agrocybe pediades]|nr:hypothetical protein CPC08DRAFT_762488 [Agrocybe pediades]
MPSGQCPSLRSETDIILSCLGTIFACCWVSVHPNIPSRRKTWLQITLRRLDLMFWSVITPEFVVGWAMRQWYGARVLEEKYRTTYPHWRRAHGHFLQMGGFVLHDPVTDQPLRVLTCEEFDQYLQEDKIKMPSITEEDIADWGKADGFSKFVVTLQTTWFLAQCIARGLQGLAMTEVELIAAALAAYNGLMYYFWWNKPLDVRSTFPVYLRDGPQDQGQEGVLSSAEAENTGDSDLSPIDNQDDDNIEAAPSMENSLVSPSHQEALASVGEPCVTESARAEGSVQERSKLEPRPEEHDTGPTPHKFSSPNQGDQTQAKESSVPLPTPVDVERGECVKHTEEASDGAYPPGERDDAEPSSKVSACDFEVTKNDDEPHGSEELPRENRENIQRRLVNSDCSEPDLRRIRIAQDGKEDVEGNSRERELAIPRNAGHDGAIPAQCSFGPTIQVEDRPQNHADDTPAPLQMDATSNMARTLTLNTRALDNSNSYSSEISEEDHEVALSFFTSICDIFNRSVLDAHQVQVRAPKYLKFLAVIHGKLSQMSLVNDLVDPKPVITDTYVPDFYAYPIPLDAERPRFFLAGSIATIGAQFGAIHCIAWSYVFPSTAEKVIWRICAMFITATLLSWHFGVIAASLTVLLRGRTRRLHQAYDALDSSFGKVAGAIICAGPILYIIARLALLTIAVTALRDIPQTAYVEVDWLSFIPHI